MAYFSTTEDNWCLIFRHDDSVVMANAETMASYFRDWRSWLSFMASSMTGEPAAMTVYQNDGSAWEVKVILASQKTPRSTYANPYGLPDHGRQPNLDL